MLPKPLRRKSVLSRVVTQTGQIEFRDAGRIDQDINSEVTILRAGEFIDEVTDGSQCGSLGIVRFDRERRTQLVEQSVFGAVLDHIGYRVAGCFTGGNASTDAIVGVNGLTESMDAVHDFLRTSMRRQMRSGEGASVNTPAERCSSVRLDQLQLASKPARRLSRNPRACPGWYNCRRSHAPITHPMKPRPAEPYWPAVLTDWCVIQALGKAGWPQRLGDSGVLQAAFVAEVSWYLRFRALYLRELEAENLILGTIELVFAEMGGGKYAAAKEQTETAQSEFLSALGRSTRDSMGILQIVGEPKRLQERMHLRAQNLDTCRRPLSTIARNAAHRAATAYWRQVSTCRLPEGFFAHAAETGAIAAMRARFDIWWALFLHSLRAVLRETNPSYARLLQALPHLRVDAARPGQKFVLTALVQQWREANAARFGLLKDIHFPVVEQRAFVKNRQVQDWFGHHAPGYDHEAATAALYAALGQVLPAQRQAYWNN